MLCLGSYQMMPSGISVTSFIICCSLPCPTNGFTLSAAPHPVAVHYERKPGALTS